MEKQCRERVFIGGSKTVGRIPDTMIGMLETLIENGSRFLVGDCHGFDLAVQTYLHTMGYDKVTVYCSGEKCRFNIGEWEEKHIAAEGTGYEFYRQKDIAMIMDCNFGMFVWDGKSRGTRNNIRDMKSKGCPLLVYSTDTGRLRAIRKII